MFANSAAQHKEINAASASVLHQALAKTGSAYGFIGPVIDGGPQGAILRVLADEGFGWDASVNRALYDKVRADYAELGYIDFPYLDNLFGWPIKHGKSIITNEPAKDYRRSGRTPAGHPPLDTFLGVPIFHGDAVVGSIGVANKAGGYNEQDSAVIEQLGTSLSALFEFYRRGIKQLEAEHRQREAEIHNEQLAQRLLDLSYVVSHELQGPCRSVESAVTRLSIRYKDKLGPDAASLIDESVVSSKLIARMVDDLWTYARVNTATNTMEEIDLLPLVQGVVDRMNEWLMAAQGSVEISLDENTKVFGVRRQLEYLLEQIIKNGIQFNQSKTPIVVIRAQRLVEETVVEFQDNGIGFDANDLRDMTRMFHKSKDSSGTGMGLAIVEAIVQFHQGRLNAQSDSRGSTWYVHLPDNAGTQSARRNAV